VVLRNGRAWISRGTRTVLAVVPGCHWPWEGELSVHEVVTLFYLELELLDCSQWAPGTGLPVPSGWTGSHGLSVLPDSSIPEESVHSVNMVFWVTL
jgi:hypothetical protein